MGYPSTGLGLAPNVYVHVVFLTITLFPFHEKFLFTTPTFPPSKNRSPLENTFDPILGNSEELFKPNLSCKKGSRDFQLQPKKLDVILISLKNSSEVGIIL